MNGTMTIISIVLVIWGLLEIILFFKVWGMTNDVEIIKNKLVVEDESNVYAEMEASRIRLIVRNLYYLNKNDEAFEALNKYLYYKYYGIRTYHRLYKNADGKYYTYIDDKKYMVEDYIKNLIVSIIPLYEKLGREIPQSLDTFNYEEFLAFEKQKKNK